MESSVWFCAKKTGKDIAAFPGNYYPLPDKYFLIILIFN